MSANVRSDSSFHPALPFIVGFLNMYVLLVLEFFTGHLLDIV